MVPTRCVKIRASRAGRPAQSATHSPEGVHRRLAAFLLNWRDVPLARSKCNGEIVARTPNARALTTAEDRLILAIVY